MIFKDLSVLSRPELLDLFIEVNEHLDDLCEPAIININDPDHLLTEERLLTIIIEIGKRYRA